MNKEILWNLVNSGLASALVILGALTTGEIDSDSFLLAIIAGLIVGVSQFRDYWKGEESEYYGKKIGSFF